MFVAVGPTTPTTTGRLIHGVWNIVFA